MELNGLKGAAAYQTYLRVMFYMRLVRESMDATGRDFKDLISELLEMDEAGKRFVFLELLAISPLSDRDILRLISVHKDENGISYSKMNIDNLTSSEIMELSIKTLTACAQSGDDLFF